MTALKKPVTLDTAFGEYVLTEIIGEGGAGRVYGGINSQGSPIAIKVLSADRISTDKRGRFKNEIAFLARNKHPNIVSVLDHGVAKADAIKGPFYVMRRYDSNLRALMLKTIPADQILPIFAKVLDGIEAAHLQGAVHRDLKPENLLYDIGSKRPAVADFGIASFTEDQIATLIETGPTQRLANFLYAAPEQRAPGRKITLTADIYALGLMLNEAFTSTVPHGTEYSRIGALHEQYGYLDAVVEKAIRQNPSERYPSVAEMRSAIATHHTEFLSRQKLSEFSDTVIPLGEVDDPLAHKAPVLVGADWDNNVLTLTLDRPVNQNWVNALRNMGNYTSVMNVGPERFTFDGRIARVPVRSEEAQAVIDFFKTWLPRATQTLKFSLEQAAEQETRKRREELARIKAAEELRLKTVRGLKI